MKFRHARRRVANSALAVHVAREGAVAAPRRVCVLVFGDSISPALGEGYSLQNAPSAAPRFSTAERCGQRRPGEALQEAVELFQPRATHCGVGGVLPRIDSAHGLMLGRALLHVTTTVVLRRAPGWRAR